MQVLQTLNTTLQTVASNPMVLNDPTMKMLFGQILSETGRISPIQLSSSTIMPPRPTVRMNENVDYKDLPPDAQSQMLSKVGISTTPGGGVGVGGNNIQKI